MSSIQEVKDILSRTSSMPWGPTRSAEVAQAAVLADALEGEEALQLEVYLELALCYQQGNEEWKALAPTAWCLTRFEEDPAAFDTDQVHDLAWLYKNAVTAAGRNPAVSREQALELSEGLGRFFQDQGFSMHSVHGSRFTLALRMGDPEKAHEELVQWRATPRDSVSDCALCDPERQITEATVAKDWERAVATAVPLLDTTEGCGNQPAGIQAASMIPLLMSGRPAAAWESHVRSYRHHRRSAMYMDILGTHMEFLVRSGRWQRALEIMRDSIALTSQAESCALLFDYLKGAALAAREASDRGRGQESFRALCTGQSQWCEGPRLDANTPLSEVAEKLADWLLAVAKLFDTRNGNDFFTASAKEVLDAHTFDDDAEELATKTWTFEIAGEREALPEGISTSDVDKPRKYATHLIRQDKVRTTDDTDPYPPVDLTPFPVPTTVQEGYDRFLKRCGITGFDVERQFIIDRVICMDESVMDIQYADEDAIFFSQFACAALIMRREYDNAKKIVSRVSEIISQLPDDPDIVSPGFFSKLMGKNASLGRKQLYESLLAIRRSYIEVDYYYIRNQAVPDDIKTRAVEAARTHRLLISAVVNQLNRGAGQARDLDIISSSIATAATMCSSCREYEEASAGYDLYESLERAFNRHASSPDRVTINVLLERAQMERERDEYMKACQYADKAMRVSPMCDPYTAIIGRAIICAGSIAAGQYDEALAQGRRLSEIIHSFPTRVYIPLAGPIFANALVHKDRVSEAVEIFEEAMGALEDTPYFRARRGELAPSLAQIYWRLNEFQDAYDLAVTEARSLRERDYPLFALSLTETAFHAAREMDDRLAKATAAHMAAEICHDLEDVDEECRWLRQEAAVIVGTPGRVSEEDERRANQVLDRARELIAPPAGEEITRRLRVLRADVNYTQGWVTLNCGDPVGAIEHLRLALDEYRELGEYDGFGYPMHAMAQCYLSMGNFDGLRECIAETTEVNKLATIKGTRLRALIRTIQEMIDAEEPREDSEG